MLPPTPAAVAAYFERKRHNISEISEEDFRHNDKLTEVCGLPESECDSTRYITREEAMRLDDPFADTRKFGPRGQYTKCAGCGTVFESLGMRLCPTCLPSSHAPRTRPCQSCGKPLPATSRKDARFCSDACRQEGHRVTDVVTDNAPGREMTSDPRLSVTPVQENQGVADHLSVTTPPSVCACCGQEFHPRRKEAKFCSAACKQRAHREHRRAAAE